MRAGGFPREPGRPRRLHRTDRRGAGTGSPSPRPWTSHLASDGANRRCSDGTAGRRQGSAGGWTARSRRVSEYRRSGGIEPTRPRGGKGAPAGGTGGGKDGQHTEGGSRLHVTTTDSRTGQTSRRDGGGHRLASWTRGYATARSEAVCRGAGCGRTRTSGSVGGQGQQRPWSTRPRRAGGCSRTRWLDPILGRETVDQPGHIGLIGEVGHAPRPRAPAAAWPAHERPGGRVPGPCRLATWQEGRVARIVDDQGLIAIGVDWCVWLDARGEDVPGPLVGPVQRAWGHVPVRRSVEPVRPVLPVANAGFGQRAARPPAARAGVGAVAVVAVVVHVPAGPHGGAGAPAEFALRTCALGRHAWPPPSPSRRLRTFRLPVAPTRANVDGRRLPAAATTRRNRVHDLARNRLDRHPR